MNKGKMIRSETGRNKFENFKLRLIALWHFITRKDYHLLVYKYRGERKPHSRVIISTFRYLFLIYSLYIIYSQHMTYLKNST